MKPPFEEAYLAEIILQADYAILSAQQVNKLLEQQANPAFVSGNFTLFFPMLLASREFCGRHGSTTGRSVRLPGPVETT